jgi:transposase-like protein
MTLSKKEVEAFMEKHGVKNAEDVQEMTRNLLGGMYNLLLEGELTYQLGYKKNDQANKKTSNSRNGYSKKEVNSKLGKTEIQVPRDRNGEFDPVVIKKHQRDISGMESQIISMYGRGLSYREIQGYLEEIYGLDVSPEFISTVTDKVIALAQEWQNRPLSPIYSVVFIDATFFHIKSDGQVKNRAVYTMLGIDLEGNKDCLGIWIGGSESAKYWLPIFNELQQRGVKDILIFSSDNLPGISGAIEASFPRAEIQKCIVHQVRNSLKHVSYKERKAMAEDLKLIYTAQTEKEGFAQLESFADKWNSQYPHVSKSWHSNWGELSTFFKYPEDLRRLIYTTNPIESLHSNMKKVAKKSTVFPNETALTKLLFLAIRNLTKRWTLRVRAWPKIYPQLLVFFEEILAEYT